jgi:hypothetical protein
MSELTTEDRQRLSTQLLDLQIDLGYLRQCADTFLERVDIANAQMKTITDILDHQSGHQAPSEE